MFTVVNDGVIMVVPFVDGYAVNNVVVFVLNHILS